MDFQRVASWNCHKFTEVREVQICHIPCFRWSRGMFCNVLQTTIRRLVVIWFVVSNIFDFSMHWE